VNILPEILNTKLKSASRAFSATPFDLSFYCFVFSSHMTQQNRTLLQRIRLSQGQVYLNSLCC